MSMWYSPKTDYADQYPVYRGTRTKRRQQYRGVHLQRTPVYDGSGPRILKIDEKTESRSLDRFRITVYTMEHGKRLGREQVDVQNADRKQPADERRMQVLYDSNTSRSCAPNKTGGRRTMMHVFSRLRRKRRTLQRQGIQRFWIPTKAAAVRQL